MKKTYTVQEIEYAVAQGMANMTRRVSEDMGVEVGITVTLLGALAMGEIMEQFKEQKEEEKQKDNGTRHEHYN